MVLFPPGLVFRLLLAIELRSSSFAMSVIGTHVPITRIMGENVLMEVNVLSLRHFVEGRGRRSALVRDDRLVVCVPCGERRAALVLSAARGDGVFGDGVSVHAEGREGGGDGEQFERDSHRE